MMKIHFLNNIGMIIQIIMNLKNDINPFAIKLKMNYYLFLLELMVKKFVLMNAKKKAKKIME